ncbi:hypothetical protein MNBD_PLANCTO02-2075 [hydrothermal vent metagenome]|uniref:Putative glutamine amidotransferase domain-containing protein n=1 Tax=hydrothermal vent metagenome TaxID=652676 RepID=A0A3B1DA17_9ZZZZ
MTKDILYCGDTHLHSAAAYLAGLMTVFDFGFDYVASEQPMESKLLTVPRKLFILSDYPAEMFSVELQNQLLEQVEAGAGLLMIGGWESFYGLGGNWNHSPVANALPVIISDADDRQNCDQPVMLQSVEDHEITHQLPWKTNAPLIGGYNRFVPKPEATVLLNACVHTATCEKELFHFELSHVDPLLVIGSFGKGRTAAFATDVAPHWVGPLVDWGDERIRGEAPHAEAIEVGSYYSQFFKQLLTWTGEL